MDKYTLEFKNQQEIIDFVNMMGNSGCNGDLKYGSIIVDACSLLGVIAIGLNKQAELTTYGEPGQNFIYNIQKYCVG
ncbi:MAG: HPr family phosphocarrier protein [Butyrivibrio sp.]